MIMRSIIFEWQIVHRFAKKFGIDLR